MVKSQLLMFLLGFLSGTTLVFLARETIERATESPPTSSLHELISSSPWVNSVDSRQPKKTLEEKAAKSPRILCLVMTAPQYLTTRALSVNATWARRCDKLLFACERAYPGLNILHVQVETDKAKMTIKHDLAWEMVYERHLSDADWFLKADDDTYIIMENLRQFLSTQDTNDPVYFGHHLKNDELPEGFFSGGGGYVLSKEALRRFWRRKVKLNPRVWYADDLEMGRIMAKVGVKHGDSRDSQGRLRFHCFCVTFQVNGYFPDWYLNYTKFGAIQGLQNMSDSPISFHYINPFEMYTMEYLVYYLRRM